MIFPRHDASFAGAWRGVIKNVATHLAMLGGYGVCASPGSFYRCSLEGMRGIVRQELSAESSPSEEWLSSGAVDME